MGHVGTRPPPLRPSSDPNAKPEYIRKRKKPEANAPHFLPEPSRLWEYTFIIVCVVVWAIQALK